KALLEPGSDHRRKAPAQMVGHRSSRGGVKDSLEVRPCELCHLDVADDREDEPLAVRRLLFPVALAPAPAPGRGSRQVKVVLDEGASPGAPSARGNSGEQPFDN